MLQNFLHSGVRVVYYSYLRMRFLSALLKKRELGNLVH